MKINFDVARFVRNFFSLASLNVLNVIFPVLLIPILVSNIGLDGFGLVSFYIAIATVFSVFVDFGFNTLGTRDIASVRDNAANKDKISTLLFYSRLLIFLVAIVFVFFGGFFVNSGDKGLYLFLVISMVLQSLIPVWYFQGLELMRFIPVISFIGKFSSFVYIYFNVTSQACIIDVGVGYFLGSVLSLFFAFYFAFGVCGFKVGRFLLKDTYDYILNSSSFFFSTLLTSSYRSFNILLVGFFVDDTSVGVFSAIWRLVSVSQSFVNSVGSAIFPFFSIKSSLKESFFLEFHYKYYVWVYAFGFLGFLSTVFFSCFFIYFFMPELVFYLDNVIFSSLLVMFGCYSYYFGFLGLLANDRQRDFLLSVLYVSVSNFFIMSAFSFLYALDGAVFSLVVVEFVLFYLLRGRVLLSGRSSE